MNESIDWRAKIGELAPALYRYFCASFPNHLADDMVQDTLMRLIEKFNSGKFDSKLGSLRMYAYGIAHFVRLEGLRLPEMQKRADLSLVSELLLTEYQMSQNENLEQLRLAIHSLSELHQQVIGLYLDEELSMDEIAAIMGIPSGTVKSHIHRAKEALKLILVNKEAK